MSVENNVELNSFSKWRKNIELSKEYFWSFWNSYNIQKQNFKVNENKCKDNKAFNYCVSCQLAKFNKFLENASINSSFQEFSLQNVSNYSLNEMTSHKAKNLKRVKSWPSLKKKDIFLRGSVNRTRSYISTSSYKNDNYLDFSSHKDTYYGYADEKSKNSVNNQNIMKNSNPNFSDRLSEEKHLEEVAAQSSMFSPFSFFDLKQVGAVFKNESTSSSNNVIEMKEPTIAQCNECYVYFNIERSYCNNRHSDSLYEPHYAVCIHGLFGTVRDFDGLVSYLLGRLKHMYVYVCESNQYQTLGGVQNSCDLLSTEIKNFFQNKSPCALSFIGHSLGGVLARAILKNLDQTGFFNDKKLINFVTFATPHVGCHENSVILTWSSRLLLDSKTMQDINNETPTLYNLTDSASLKVLRNFRKLVAYGNVEGDWLVGTRTALILPYRYYSNRLVNEVRRRAKDKPGQPIYIVEKNEKSDSLKASEKSYVYIPQRSNKGRETFALYETLNEKKDGKETGNISGETFLLEELQNGKVKNFLKADSKIEDKLTFTPKNKQLFSKNDISTFHTEENFELLLNKDNSNLYKRMTNSFSDDEILKNSHFRKRLNEDDVIKTNRKELKRKTFFSVDDTVFCRNKSLTFNTKNKLNPIASFLEQHKMKTEIYEKTKDKQKNYVLNKLEEISSKGIETRLTQQTQKRNYSNNNINTNGESSSESNDNKNNSEFSENFVAEVNEQTNKAKRNNATISHFNTLFKGWNEVCLEDLNYRRSFPKVQYTLTRRLRQYYNLSYALEKNKDAVEGSNYLDSVRCITKPSVLSRKLCESKIEQNSINHTDHQEIRNEISNLYTDFPYSDHLKDKIFTFSENNKIDDARETILGGFVEDEHAKKNFPNAIQSKNKDEIITNKKSNVSTVVYSNEIKNPADALYETLDYVELDSDILLSEIMLCSLNTLHWERYAVYLPSQLQAHVHIILHPRLRNLKGKQVLQHFVEEVFIT